MHLSGNEFSLGYRIALRFAIGAADFHFKRERFERDDFVCLRRRERLGTLGAVHDDRVVVGPDEFNDLLHLVFLTEEIPPKLFKHAGWRSKRSSFNLDSRRALPDEHIIAGPGEVFGKGHTSDFEGLHGWVNCIVYWRA
jgi:hypothetical protein